MPGDDTLAELASLLADTNDAELIYDFLSAMLTPTEQQKIILRWELVRLLEQGMSQRAVAEELGVSLCKITRGSHELQHGPPGFREMVKASLTKNK